MELTDLQVFVSVARAGAITKAARELHTVQSNISARIASLEKELGALVFRRHARGVVLTSAGEQLLPYAQQILRLAREARGAVRDGTPGGPLRIGALETTAGIRLPPALAAFTSECSEVDLSLVTGPTDVLVRAVLDYELDGALVTGPVRSPELLETAMFVEQLVVVTSRWCRTLDDALQGGAGPRLLVFRAGCSYRRGLESLVRDRGVLPAKVLEYGTLEGILGCVAAGLGITLLPLAAVESYRDRELLRTHEPATHGRAETVFVRRADSVPTAALTRFVEHVRGATDPAALPTATPVAPPAAALGGDSL
jgi:DNA-binding transcriptional LysR family regulator